jgi:hypothetical protein
VHGTTNAAANADPVALSSGLGSGVGRTVTGLGQGVVCSFIFSESKTQPLTLYQGDTVDGAVGGIGKTVGGPVGTGVGNVGKGGRNLVTGVTGGVGDGVGKLGTGDIVGGLGSTVGGIGKGLGGLASGLAGYDNDEK